MKKILNLAAIALLSAGVAQAQRATEYDLHSSSQDIRSYNRIGVSYNNTHYGYNKDAKDDSDYDGFSLNGFGLEYVRGFKLSSSLPMFLEVGVNANFGFSSQSLDESDNWEYKVKYQDINVQVPVNFVYRFNIADKFSIAPYLGINLKAHALTRMKFEDYYKGELKDEAEWMDCFSKDDMGKDETWNRFQLGWQIGAYFQYSKIYLGLQYGTDFIPAYSHNFKEYDYHPKINTGTFKLSVGYSF